MEQIDKLAVKESNVSMTTTKQMASIPMQMSFIPFNFPLLLSLGQTSQLNSLMPLPYIPPLRPPKFLGKPQSVQSFSEYNIISREIYYGSVTKTDTCLKEDKSSIQTCQKSLIKFSQTRKSSEVSVTEKFCKIAKQHGLTVELVTNEECPNASRKESQQSPLNSTQPKLQSFDSSHSEGLDKKKHLNPLVDEYVPHASLCPRKESNVDLVLKQHPATEENTVDDSVKCEPVTEENLSITKSVSGKDVRDPSGSNFDGGYQPSSALQTIPPLRPLLLPIMPKVKKMRTLKDAIVQTDNDGKPASRLCPNCQRKSSDSDKCTATLVFKNINLEQKTKYLALQASFLTRDSAQATKSEDEWKKILKKKLQMLYKQFGTKDTGVSHWEDELICQVVISLLKDSPALASLDQNSILLARLREEVNILNEITVSLLEENPGKITEISEPQLNSELKKPLQPSIAIRTEETLPDNTHSATKSALMTCQGSAIMAEGMHLSNSSSGVSLSSADLSTGPAISAVVSPTTLAVSVCKKCTADPIQEDPSPKSGVTNVVDNKTMSPLANKVNCPNQTYSPSLQQFLDTLGRSCNTEQTFPISVASTNSTTDHLQHKNISGKKNVFSVEQKGNKKSENIKTGVDSQNDLDNRQLKGTSSASKTYAMLLSTIGNCDRKNPGFKPLVIRPLDKNYKFKAPDHSQDSNDSPCKEAPKSSTFENIEKADKLRSRNQSETSDLSDKDTHSSLTSYKPKAVQETGHCEVNNQVVDLKKSPGRLSQFKTPEHPTDTWLKAKLISLHNKISSDQSSKTLSNITTINNSISDVHVPNTSNPQMQSHNLMLNPPLSVTALAGFISNVSDTGSSSAAVFPTSSEWSDESPLQNFCEKAPLNVRVRKVSRKGLQSVKDWVIGNVESTHQSVPSFGSTIKRQIESHSGHSRIKAPNTSTADNQYHEAVEENSFASHKYLTPFDKKRMSTLSPQEQKTSNDFNIEDMTEFEKATHLPENKKNLYTPQSLLNKYCYSSVAARFIALASKDSSTFQPLSNFSNATPERDSYPTMIKTSSSFKTLTIVSSQSTCLAATPLNKCSWKEGDDSSWKGKTSSHSCLNNNEYFQTEKPLIANANCGDHDEDIHTERMFGNIFNQDTKAGDCKIDMTPWNSNNNVEDNSTKKNIERQDWFDIDNISLSESFSSLIKDDVYTGEDMSSCSLVLNNNRTNEKSMNGSDEVHHDYVTRKSKRSALEGINWWDENDKEEIKRNTDQVKQDTKKSSGVDSLVWMTVTNTRKQKVSVNDRIQEFRQQEKYKNLTTRILEIYKNLSREEAQDILETVFTMTDGMTGMRQPQILSEVHAALTEIYPEKMIVQKEVNLNISAKCSTAKSSKNTRRQSKSINKTKQSSDSTARLSGKLSKYTSTIDNISSASDSDSSDMLLWTSEQNNEKQIADETVSVHENDFTRSNNLVKIDKALTECFNVASTEKYVPEKFNLDIGEAAIPVSFKTYGT